MKKAVVALLTGTLILAPGLSSCPAAAQSFIQSTSVDGWNAGGASNAAGAAVRGVAPLSFVRPLAMPFDTMPLWQGAVLANLGLSAPVAASAQAPQPAIVLPMAANDSLPAFQAAIAQGLAATLSGLGRRIQRVFAGQSSDAPKVPDRMVVFLSFIDSWAGTLEDHIRLLVDRYGFKLDEDFAPGRTSVRGSWFTTVRGSIPRGNLSALEQDGSVFSVTPARDEAKFRVVEE